MTNNTQDLDGLVCPIPLAHDEKIVLGHGSGGKMSQDLIEKTFLPPLDNPILRAANDAGVAEIVLPQTNGENISGRLAISTDSHVVKPIMIT